MLNGFQVINRDLKDITGKFTPIMRQLLSVIILYSNQNNIKPKPQEVGKTEDSQTIWRCRICGYEYVGEELPDDFICPLCKHPASDFEKVVK